MASCYAHAHACLTSSKQEQKFLSMGLDMRTNNVEVLKNID